jgi:uncharacterized small protein (DUF1192 family)
MPKTTISTEEFFKHFGPMPIKFADTVYSTLPAPTINELFEHFKTRLSTEDKLEPVVDAVHEGIEHLLNRISALESEIAELRAAKKPSGKASAPANEGSSA